MDREDSLGSVGKKRLKRAATGLTGVTAATADTDSDRTDISFHADEHAPVRLVRRDLVQRLAFLIEVDVVTRSRPVRSRTRLVGLRVFAGGTDRLCLRGACTKSP